MRMRYLVLACKPRRVIRSHCATVASAALACRVYRGAGWAVTAEGGAIVKIQMSAKSLGLTEE